MFAALIVGGLALAVAAAAWWLRAHYAVVSVTGSSMEPAFRSGERVLVRRGRSPGKGDVVVLERPTRPGRWTAPPPTTRLGNRAWIVKRVAATPGDLVPIEIEPAVGTATDDRPRRVPPDHLVVLGDNPDASLDSRGFGLIPTDRLLGRVVRRLPHR